LDFRVHVVKHVVQGQHRRKVLVNFIVSVQIKNIIGVDLPEVNPRRPLKTIDMAKIQ
jgi:hypothetical protein